MKTIRIKIYKFDELNENAKQNAIENYRNNNLDFDFIYYDAEKTVEAFCEAFKVNTGNHSWLDCNTNNIDNDILNLTGLRLRKYILNNFGETLYKRKYLKHGELVNERKPFHRMMKQSEITNNCSNKGKFSISYYSNIQKEAKNCNLTGMCYDDNMMQPIYDFLELRSFDSTNFDDLLNACFDAIRKTLKDEEEYMYTDEYISEEILANDFEFTQDGKQF
jgi:hypothetical protein